MNRVASLVLACVIPVSLAACAKQSPQAEPAAALHAVEIDGVELHYLAQGEGIPVVLVHGSLADYTYWELSGQLERLSDDFHVLAYSRRYNFPNRNSREPDHSPMVEARDLAGLIEGIGRGPVHLVGHSYGAYTALVFALEHPGRVRSLVLAEPPIISWLPDIPGGEGMLEGFMAHVWAPLGEAFAKDGAQGGLEFTSQWYFKSSWEDVSPEWQVLFRRNVKEWRALAESAHAFPNLEYERVRELTVPVLLISAGRNAGGFNDLIDGQLAHLLPDAERVVMPDVSHEMFLDDPQGSADIMLDFIRRH